jgi:hypothetical protein
MHNHHAHWDLEHPHGDHEHSPRMPAGFVILLVWSLAWKAASLWRAAKDDSKPWFATLFVVNSAGILDALYLFKFSPSRKRWDDALAEEVALLEETLDDEG